jgi:hypothetical protein
MERIKSKVCKMGTMSDVVEGGGGYRDSMDDTSTGTSTSRSRVQVMGWVLHAEITLPVKKMLVKWVLGKWGGGEKG